MVAFDTVAAAFKAAAAGADAGALAAAKVRYYYFLGRASLFHGATYYFTAMPMPTTGVALKIAILTCINQ